ncbi:hypothetical protein O9992_24625 [Vibrio lentus]|nr:hypothetical protein [Vibrio lentus]
MDDAIRTESLIIMEKAISLAYKLGIRCIQNGGLRCITNHSNRLKLTLAVKGMQQATKMAERAGIMLGVEIMDTPATLTL